MKIGFTGSTAVGKKILADAAEGMKPVSIECGGKNPLIVCADANIDEVRTRACWLLHNLAWQLEATFCMAATSHPSRFSEARFFAEQMVNFTQWHWAWHTRDASLQPCSDAAKE